jgi:hypothetical protein
MTIKSRLDRLEKRAPAAPDERDAGVRVEWESFLEWMQGVVASYPAAIKSLRESAAANAWVWKTAICPEGKKLSSAHECWKALEDFPDASAEAVRAFALLESEQRTAWRFGEKPPSYLLNWSELSSGEQGAGGWSPEEEDGWCEPGFFPNGI